GVGEQMTDLQEFNANAYLNTLLDPIFE
ncbi:hypothetical protein, partial [Campylobacter jejuni]